MISFHQFRLKLKEALSLDDPLAQSTLKITDKSSQNIIFEFNLDNEKYDIDIYITPKIFRINNQTLGELNLMDIYLSTNGTYNLTNQSGMKANTVYNMLLNAIKQAHDHFGENNIYGYRFAGAQSNQDIMYDKLMKKFAPNLITWFTSGIYLKPESVQKLKDQNPDLIEEINNQIHQATSKREMSIKQSKKNKNLQRSLLRRQP